MTAVQVVCYAFLTGLTLSGLVGTVLELVAGRHLTFAEPFVSREHVVRSLASSAAAGPFMLGNDALDAWRGGDVSAFVLVSCALTAFAWVLATGVVALGVVSQASVLF